MQMSDYKFATGLYTFLRVEVNFCADYFAEKGYTGSINHFDVDEIDLALYA